MTNREFREWFPAREPCEAVFNFVSGTAVLGLLSPFGHHRATPDQPLAAPAFDQFVARSAFFALKMTRKDARGITDSRAHRGRFQRSGTPVAKRRKQVRIALPSQKLRKGSGAISTPPKSRRWKGTLAALARVGSSSGSACSQAAAFLSRLLADFLRVGRKTNPSN